ncbi:MAG: hypothetical protein QGG53_33225, partial [Planctomycetota bacterium]|nr:hypothetical protein [Planctomycetota bacterium]
PGGIKDGLSGAGVPSYPGSFMDATFEFRIERTEKSISIIVEASGGSISIRRRMTIHSSGTGMDIWEEITNLSKSSLAIQPRLHAEFALGWPNFKTHKSFFHLNDQLRTQPLRKTPGKVDSNWFGAIDLSHGEAVLIKFDPEQVQQIYTGVWTNGTISTVEPFGKPKKVQPGDSVRLDLSFWLFGDREDIDSLTGKNAPSKQASDALAKMYQRVKRDEGGKHREEPFRFVPAKDAMLLSVSMPATHRQARVPLPVQVSARAHTARTLKGKIDLIAEESGKVAASAPFQMDSVALAGGVGNPRKTILLKVTGLPSGKYRARFTSADQILAPPASVELIFGFDERLLKRRKEREDRFRAAISKTRHRIPIQWSGQPPKAKGFPIRFGIPLPRGLKRTVENMRIDGAISHLTPLALWPDGSLQWVLAHFQSMEGGTYAVEFGSGVKSANSPGWKLDAGMVIKNIRESYAANDVVSSVTVSRCADNRKTDSGFTDETFTAKFSEADWQLEYDRPMLRTVRAEGWHTSESGERSALFVFRVDMHMGLLTRIQHTIIYSGEPDEDFIKDISLSFALRSKEISKVTAGTTGFVFDDPEDELFMLQDELDHWEIRTRDRRGREALQKEGRGSFGGYVSLWGDEPKLAVFIKQAAENNPKSISFDPRSGLLRVGLYPSETKRLLDVRRYNKKISRGYPDYETGSETSTAQGFAKTHDIWLRGGHWQDTAETYRDLAETIDHPPVPWLGDRWYAGTEAAGHFHPYDPERFPRLEAAARLLCDAGIIQTERAKLHNWINFGDWLGMPTHGSYFGRGRYGWTNNDAHPARALYYNWLRTGHREYYDALAAMSWHAMDIDLVHYADGGDRPWSHGRSNLGRTRRHSRSHWSLYSTGPWTDGVAQYYMLSGEPRLLETLVFSADHGTHLANLARLLAPVAASPKYKDRLDRYTREVEAKLESYTRQNGTFRWAWEVLPGALDYFEWTGSPEVGQQLLEIAPKSGSFSRGFHEALTARLTGKKEHQEAVQKAIQKWKARGSYPAETMRSTDLGVRLDALYDLVNRDHSTWQEANYSLPSSQIPFVLATLADMEEWSGRSATRSAGSKEVAAERQHKDVTAERQHHKERLLLFDHFSNDVAVEWCGGYLEGGEFVRGKVFRGLRLNKALLHYRTHQSYTARPELPGGQHFDVRRGTLRLWFKPDEALGRGQPQTFFYSSASAGEADTFHLWSDGKGRLRFTVTDHRGKAWKTSARVKSGAGRWACIEAAWQTGTGRDGFLSLRVDGKEIDKARSSIQVSRMGTELWIGSSAGKQKLHGVIDELRIWDRPLSPNELAPEAKDAVIGFSDEEAREQGLLFYHRFDSRVSCDPDGYAGGKYPVVVKGGGGESRPGMAGRFGHAAQVSGPARGSLQFATEGHFNPAAGTVATWFKPSQTLLDHWGHLFAEYYRFCDIRVTGRRFNFESPAGRIISRFQNIKADEWYHVAVTWDLKAQKYALYVNGKLDTEMSKPPKVTNNQNVFHIGGDEHARQSRRATYDEFRIYSRALSASEIESLFETVVAAPAFDY